MLFLSVINALGLNSLVAGERITNYIWCLGIIAATILLKKPLTQLVARVTAGIASRFSTKEQSTEFCSAVHKPLEALLQTILFFIAINQLPALLDRFFIRRVRSNNDVLAIRYGDIADHIFLFLFILYLTLVISRTLEFIYRVQLAKAVNDRNKERQQLLPLLKEMVKLFVWAMGMFWVLGSVFHVNIPALITGLGIGGVAIALAGKESVENFFAAVTLLMDKPFQAGDTIRIGNMEGVVERIGFRSTWMRNTDGSMFIVPNKKLVNENLENLSERNKKSIKLTISIKYGIEYSRLQLLVQELKEMVADIPGVLAPVEAVLDSFGENVFNILISYNLSPSGGDNSESSVKQEINMRAYQIIAKYTGPEGATVKTGNAPETKV